jgi:hypothetical protein
MSEPIALSVVANSDLIEELRPALVAAGLRASEPMPATSPADALNAPIGASEDEIYEIVTVLLETGADVAAFTERLAGALDRHPSAEVVLRDARTGRRRGRARRGLSMGELTQMATS